MRTAPITSRSSADLDDLVGPFTGYAPARQRVPGLVFKARIQDGETPGGFRVFTDRHCAVREELTGMTGSLRLAAQGGR